jgi:hypothetical protein
MILHPSDLPITFFIFQKIVYCFWFFFNVQTTKSQKIPTTPRAKNDMIKITNFYIKAHHAKTIYRYS